MRTYYADIERNYEKMDNEVAALWAEKVIADMKITDHRTKVDIWCHATMQQSIAVIINIYRKL